MMDRRKRARLKRVLAGMRLNFIAFAALIVIAVIGISLIRSTLFDNAWETGTRSTGLPAKRAVSTALSAATMMHSAFSISCSVRWFFTPSAPLVSTLMAICISAASASSASAAI